MNLPRRRRPQADGLRQATHSAQHDGTPVNATRRVRDPLVRVLHCSLVSAVAASWLGTFAIAGAHQPAGYLALAIVLLRTAWGFVGSHHAQFSEFVRGPRQTCHYLRALRRHAEARYLGHNPLGGWMVLALLTCIMGLGLTGWLYTTDALWGNPTVDSLNRALAWGLLALVAVHVAGVLFTSHRQHENLVEAMFTGDKAESAQAHGHGSAPMASDPRRSGNACDT
jgi:cytochrome b